MSGIDYAHLSLRVAQTVLWYNCSNWYLFSYKTLSSYLLETKFECELFIFNEKNARNKKQ